MSYHYAFEASRLLEQCIDELLQLIECDESGRRPLSSSNATLYDIKESLATVEVHLYHFFLLVIDKEGTAAAAAPATEDSAGTDEGSWNQDVIIVNHHHHHPCVDLHTAVDSLRRLLDERPPTVTARTSTAAASSVPHTYYPSRSVADSLLFRLNVALQLCLVRLDDARRVIGGGAGGSRRCSPNNHNPLMAARSTRTSHWQPSTSFRWKRRLCIRTLHTTTALLTLGSCSLWFLYPSQQQQPARPGRPRLLMNGYFRTLAPYQSILVPITQLSWGIVGTRWIRRMWGKLWMRVTLSKSAESIEEWCRQWSLIMQCRTTNQSSSRAASSSSSRSSSRRPAVARRPSCEEEDPTASDGDDDTSSNGSRNRRLIEYALHDTSKVRE